MIKSTTLAEANSKMHSLKHHSLTCAALLLALVACGGATKRDRTYVASNVQLLPAALGAERLYLAANGEIIASSRNQTWWIKPGRLAPEQVVPGWPLTSATWPAPYLTWQTDVPIATREVVAPDGYRIVDPVRNRSVKLLLPTTPERTVAMEDSDPDFSIWDPVEVEPAQWIVHDSLWSKDGKTSYVVFYSRPVGQTWIVKLDAATWQPLASATLASAPFLHVLNLDARQTQHGSSVALSEDGGLLYVATFANRSIQALATTDLSVRWVHPLTAAGDLSATAVVLATGAQSLVVLLGQSANVADINTPGLDDGVRGSKLVVLGLAGEIIEQQNYVGVVQGLGAVSKGLYAYTKFAYRSGGSAGWLEHDTQDYLRPHFEITQLNNEGGTVRSIYKDLPSPWFGSSATLWDETRQQFWVAPINVEGLKSLGVVPATWRGSVPAEAAPLAITTQRASEGSVEPSVAWLRVQASPLRLAKLSGGERRKFIEDFLSHAPIDRIAILKILLAAPVHERANVVEKIGWTRLHDAIDVNGTHEFETLFPKLTVPSAP